MTLLMELEKHNKRKEEEAKPNKSYEELLDLK
jgi:hypothetical protein